MQRSLSHIIRTLSFAAATVLGAGLAPLPANADILTPYEPGFLRQAERALNRGAPERALKLLKENADRQVKTRHRAEAHGMACRAHLALQDPVEARSSCLAALDVDRGADSWRYLNNLGVAEMALGNYDAAQSAFSRAVARGTMERTPRRNLSRLQAARDAMRNAGDTQVVARIR